ncbi:hypothetical protein ACODT3_15790 [Streptomyces sp. 4.24]|uniref:hypothetical protein n=1 Tax=Streptomyces tritrimontium TaxID=3406573 RepID=UPI003BB6BB35
MPGAATRRTFPVTALGSGGMGRVLLGAAPDGRLVAVKHVHAGLAADDGFRARFRREVAASQKVSGAYTAAVMDADAPTPQTLYDVVHAEPDLSGVPAGLRGIVERCLAKDPAARPTPAELLGLLGPVAPVGRQWPPAVYRMTAAQRAGIDRLLDGPGDTVVEAPVRLEKPGPPSGAGASGPPPKPLHPPRPAPVPEPIPVPDASTGERHAALPTEAGIPRAEPAPPRRRAPRRALITAVCVLAVAALGGTAYGLWPYGTAGKSIEPGKYRSLADCAELAPKLPLQPRDQGSDRHSSTRGETQTSCTWYGGSGKNGARTVRVRWNLLADDGVRDAAQAQATAFRALTAGGKQTSVGFGDEAFWGAADTATSCSPGHRLGGTGRRPPLSPPSRSVAEPAAPPGGEDSADLAVKRNPEWIMTTLKWSNPYVVGHTRPTLRAVNAKKSQGGAKWRTEPRQSKFECKRVCCGSMVRPIHCTTSPTSDSAYWRSTRARHGNSSFAGPCSAWSSAG